MSASSPGPPRVAASLGFMSRSRPTMAGPTPASMNICCAGRSRWRTPRSSMPASRPGLATPMPSRPSLSRLRRLPAILIPARANIASWLSAGKSASRLTRTAEPAIPAALIFRSRPGRRRGGFVRGAGGLTIWCCANPAAGFSRGLRPISAPGGVPRNIALRVAIGPSMTAAAPDNYGDRP